MYCLEEAQNHNNSHAKKLERKIMRALILPCQMRVCVFVFQREEVKGTSVTEAISVLLEQVYGFLVLYYAFLQM